ncbi:hypothetical protein OG539_32570 [Actinacidiphila glaucinigra]|uniref:hypothetical protein n=1 Tax=Actinacidiphila glaucinigra TaxID=235986 RepID=UPI00324B594D
MNDTLSGRIPLVLRTTSGEIRQTVAALPTKTPGLLVFWAPNLLSYGIAGAQGQYLASGWDRADGAVQAANGLRGITDWTTATRETVMELPFRTIKLIGQMIGGSGGQFLTDILGTRQSAELRAARDLLAELDEEIEADFFEPPSPVEAYRTIRDQRDTARAEIERLTTRETELTGLLERAITERHLAAGEAS